MRTRRSNDNLTPIINYLIECGADVREALAIVIRYNAPHDDLKLALIDASDPEDLNAGENHTLLGIACWTRNLTIVTRLLERGADPRIQARYGATGLWSACKHGNIEIVKLLLTAVTGDVTELVNEADNEGVTPLMVTHSVEIAKFLIEKGAVTGVRDMGGSTALMYAADVGYTAIVKLLVDHGEDINTRNFEGHTALSLACHGERCGAIDYVNNLLDLGARIDQTAIDAAEGDPGLKYFLLYRQQLQANTRNIKACR
jgi:ankyrin repeat protein